MELTFKPFKVKAASGDATLTFRAFQGSMRLTLNEGNKMVFDTSIPDDRWIVVRNSAVKAINLTPGQKIVLVFSKYNLEAKKMEHDWVMTIMKDDRQCFSISVECASAGKFIFPLKGPYNISIGSDPMPEHEKSMIGLETLIEFMKSTSVFQRVLSNNKEYWTKMMEQNKGRSGFNNNSNYQTRQGGGSGSQPPAKASNNDDTDEAANYF